MGVLFVLGAVAVVVALVGLFLKLFPGEDADQPVSGYTSGEAAGQPEDGAGFGDGGFGGGGHGGGGHGGGFGAHGGHSGGFGGHGGGFGGGF